MTIKPTAFLVAALFATVPAWASTPPSAFILKSLAAKHGGIKGLRVRSVVTAMDGEKLGSTRFKTVTHYNPQNGTIHAYALDESNQKLYAVDRKVESATPADALLFWSNGQHLSLALKAKGIPVRTADELARMSTEEDRRASEQVYLARWGTTVAWVIGDESRKPGPKEAPKDPQLWVEKDSFLPLRLVAGTPGDDALVDLQFEGQRYYREFPYPRVIVAVKGKSPVLRDEVQDVSFSFDAAEFRNPVAAGFTEAGNAASGALKDLIKQYFEMVR